MTPPVALAFERARQILDALAAVDAAKTVGEIKDAAKVYHELNARYAPSIARALLTFGPGQ